MYLKNNNDLIVSVLKLFAVAVVAVVMLVKALVKRCRTK